MNGEIRLNELNQTISMAVDSIANCYHFGMCKNVPNVRPNIAIILLGYLMVSGSLLIEEFDIGAPYLNGGYLGY